jgi:hypothetical protein
VVKLRLNTAQLGFILLATMLAAALLPAKEHNKDVPIAWCHIQAEQTEVARRAGGQGTFSLSLSRGTLAPVIKTRSSNGRNLALIRMTDLATLRPMEGWVDSSQTEIISLDRFPSDEALLRQLESEYQDEFIASRVAVVRWLIRQGDSGTALVCFIVSTTLPVARLVAFLPAQGTFIPGPSLDFPFSEMKPGIISGEVRDLLRDGNECFVTREPFRKGIATRGVNMVIRRLENGSFQSLWTAPIEFRSLDSFPSRLQILQPPEKNIGAPSTVTKGEVEFQQSANVQAPVWKGKVEFFTAGGGKPIQSVSVTKVCAWDGSRFAPLP